ncbi:cation:proton antiporter [Bacillus sp. FJAT-29790]|nr:cation:proton antiporter [Bacillus sp. FJAT-29790]
MEEHGVSAASLVTVILIAFLTPILLHRLKLNFIPVVVAEFLMGLVIGKSGLDVVHPDMWLETLSTLGFIFLVKIWAQIRLGEFDLDFFSFYNNCSKISTRY